jgi:glutamine cyclotransferase
MLKRRTLTGGGALKRRYLMGFLVALLALALGLLAFTFLSNIPNDTAPDTPLNYTFSVVNVYPHDKNAFTQGLVFEDGVLYEGTGLYGESTLRRVELETGNVLQLYALPDQFFGEGITVFEGKIIQLTWQSHKGFVYDKDSFELLLEFSYPTEGWGITHDGSRLIMSDGTATLHFLNPETFEEVGHVEVYDGNRPVTRLNELEYIQGKVYANIWTEEKIAIINPQTGQVKGWINLSGLRERENLEAGNVLNGIAYDAKEDRLFVTGKLWSLLFQIELIPA